MKLNPVYFEVPYRHSLVTQKDKKAVINTVKKYERREAKYGYLQEEKKAIIEVE